MCYPETISYTLLNMGVEMTHELNARYVGLKEGKFAKIYREKIYESIDMAAESCKN